MCVYSHSSMITFVFQSKNFCCPIRNVKFTYSSTKLCMFLSMTIIIVVTILLKVYQLWSDVFVTFMSHM